MDEQLQNADDLPQEKAVKGGFGWGILTGVFASLMCAAFLVVCVFAYCKLSNHVIILGNKNGIAQMGVLDGRTMDKIKEISHYIDARYYDAYDLQKLQDSMIKGMVSGLEDRYSVYYTPEEYEELQLSTTGVYHGIGAGLTQDASTMQVTITRVYEGTPAEEAGLKKGDVILRVDDVESVSMELSALVQLIRGEEGTSVHLELYRPDTEETFGKDVVRRNVELPSVSCQMLGDGIGYIEITEFQSNTAAQFEQKLAELENQGMNALIVDVRSNPGGLVSSVVQILDDILPEGTVVYTENKYGKRETYTSDANCLTYPIAVLVDENSASASEIFAGAIKDYAYGTLIGKKTFGKGIVQSIFPLRNGDALKITTAKYFTPSGNNIHGIGIEPDIELDYEFLGPEDAVYDVLYDNQVQKAVEVLKGEE